MEATPSQHRNNIIVPSYTVGFKAFKKIAPTGRQKLRELRVYKNGELIYFDLFEEEDRVKHEQWAYNFISAMKQHDVKEMMKALDEMWGI